MNILFAFITRQATPLRKSTVFSVPCLNLSSQLGTLDNAKNVNHNQNFQLLVLWCQKEQKKVL